jgi:hypothetical protein
LITAANYTFPYYINQQDAEDDIIANSVQNPTAYLANNGSVIYIRVVDNTTGCYAVTSFTFAIVKVTVTSIVSTNFTIPFGDYIDLELQADNYLEIDVIIT